MKIPITIAISLLIILNCPLWGDTNPAIVIRKGLNLAKSDIHPRIPKIAVPGGGRVRIVIFIFTRGVEKYSYSDEGKLRYSQTEGLLEALVTLNRRKAIEQARFITARGETKEEILADFGKKVKGVLSRF